MDYADDNQIVFVRYRGRRVLAQVACAAGDSARIVNEKYGLNIWVPVAFLQDALATEDQPKDLSLVTSDDVRRQIAANVHIVRSFMKDRDLVSWNRMRLDVP